MRSIPRSTKPVPHPLIVELFHNLTRLRADKSVHKEHCPGTVVAKRMVIIRILWMAGYVWVCLREHIHSTFSTFQSHWNRWIPEQCISLYYKEIFDIFTLIMGVSARICHRLSASIKPWSVTLCEYLASKSWNTWRSNGKNTLTL